MAALAFLAQTSSDGWFFSLRRVNMSSFSHKSFVEQVDLFESRGMLFDGEQDKKKAEQKLSIISYYKLKEFARPFSKIEIVDGERRINYQNTKFKKIPVRYYQDKRLRLYLLDALEDIEVALKTQVAFVLGYGRLGPYGYLDFSQWCNKKEYCKHYLAYREDKFKKQLKAELKRTTSPEINEKLKIDNVKYPPIWLAINLMTFGQIINLIELMSTSNIRQIAKQYDCSDAELISWLKCLNLLRNMCAHNSNIIDLKMHTTPMLREEWKGLLFELKEGVYSNRIALPIIIVKYMMEAIDNQYNFKEILGSFKKLVDKSNKQANYYGLKSKDVLNIIQNNSLYSKI